MSTHDGQIPVLDVDQVFPVLTADSASRGGSPAAGEDQSATVSAALRTVLGWRPRAQDTQAFAAALRASFQLSEAEGHTVSRYVPGAMSMQADLGGISGGQASLYSRARLAAQQATALLDGLTPLRIDYDPQDGEAFRTLVRHGVARLVEELGNPGGPRQAIVDGAFDVLLGRIPPAASGGLAVLSGYTPDTVPGQLGALRDRFGLVDANVNTVDEEALRTSFWTLVDLVLDLRRAWEAQKADIGGGTGSGFLGTDLVVVNRLMAAAAEQVDELEAVLDSALVGRAERTTVVLGRDSGLTLDGLLAWTRRFLTEDGPLYLRDTGRDGIRTAFAPLAQQLVTTLRRQLVDPLGGTGSRASSADPKQAQAPEVLAYVPVGWQPRFPSGMYAARTRIAVSGLSRLLENLFSTSARISRYPGIVLFDVEVTPLLGPYANGPSGAVRVAVRGANVRPGYLPAFYAPVHLTPTNDAVGSTDGLRRRTRLVLPMEGSVTVDDDTMTGVFSYELWQDITDGLNLPDPGQGGVVLPAQSVPVAVIDGETGQVVESPVVRDWPAFNRARSVVTDQVDWADVPEDDVQAGRAVVVPGRVPGMKRTGRSNARAEQPLGGEDDLVDEADDVPRVPRARVGNGDTHRSAASDDTGDPPDEPPARRAPRGRRTGPDGGRGPRAARDRAGVTAVLERDEERDETPDTGTATDTDTAPRRRPAKRAQRAEPARERAPRKQAPRKRAARGAAEQAREQGTPTAGAGGDEEGPPGDRREQPGGADTDGS